MVKVQCLYNVCIMSIANRLAMHVFVERGMAARSPMDVIMMLCVDAAMMKVMCAEEAGLIVFIEASIMHSNIFKEPHYR